MAQLLGKDVYMVVGAVSELVTGIGVENLKIKIGKSDDELLEFRTRLFDASWKDQDTIELPYDDLELARNILCELLKELDHFEFQVRTGNTEEETLQALVRIKIDLDDARGAARAKVDALKNHPENT